VRGELKEGDKKTEEGAFIDVYSINVREGQIYMIEMVSPTVTRDEVETQEFDTVVGVATGLLDGDNLKYNDDNGDNLNSRLVFEANEPGPYYVRAAALGSEQGGAYTISFREATRDELLAADALAEVMNGEGEDMEGEELTGPSGPVTAPSRIPEIRRGASVRGELNARDPVNDDDQPVDVYRLNARQGQTYFITMTAAEIRDGDDSRPAFDTYLGLSNAVQGPENILFNDDSDGSTNSSIEFTAVETGPVYIRAAALMEEGYGSYTLSIE
jgi:hypothetical protein